MRTAKITNRNIKEFAKHKLLARVSKPHSKNTVGFYTNDPDGWFIDKVTYATKSGEIHLIEGVNADSFPEFVEWYKGNGYKEVK